MSIFIPKYLFFLIQKKNNLCILTIYTKKIYLLLFINTFKYYKHLNIIHINKYSCNSLCNTGNFINKYIFIWNIFFIKKIKFKGKGYKIMKNKKFFFLIFNNSHITWYIFINIISLKITKQKYLFLYKNKCILQKKLKVFYNIRPWNIFTKRGLRFSKQKIWKKIGKRTL